MKRERVLIIVAAVAIVAYAVFLVRNLSYAAGGPDSGGYMNEAKLIASGHVTEPVPLVRELGLDDSWLTYFMPLGFAPSRHGSMHPLYPPGLPMHLAAAGRIGGWTRVPFYVAPLAAVGCVILMIAIARQLAIPFALAVAGAAAIALFPPLLWHAVQPASDVLAMFWALLAMWFALQAERRPSATAVAGIAFAIGVWVRPTNALMVIPLAIAVRFRWRSLVTIAMGTLPLIVALMVWNANLYGGPFRTGYGSIPLSWHRFRFAAPLHAEWLFKMSTAVVFPCGLLVAFDRAIDAWKRWLLASWFAIFYVFYSFYGFWDGYLCLRFLLPAIPALVFGALLLMRRLPVVITALLCVWMIATPVYYGRQFVIPIMKTTESEYPQYVAFAKKHVPDRSIVITGGMSGAFLLYEQRSIVRYDQLDDERFQTLRAYATLHDLPWYAVVGDEEIDLAGLRKRFRGDWKPVAQFAHIGIYRLD